MTPRPQRWSSAHLAFVAIYFFAAGLAGIKIARHEREISRLIDQVAARQDLNSVTNMDVNLNPGRMGKVTSFLLKISNRNITNTAKATANRQEILDQMGSLNREIFASTEACAALIGASVLFLLASRWRQGPAGWTRERKIYDLLAVSLPFFVVGISCPVLTAAVRGQHMLIGAFVIETSSKGIVTTVISLFRSGNGIIGALLAGFSIGIPVFKGVAVISSMLQPSAAKRARIGRYLEIIGKWSLTDVVVAAVLLAVFSLNAIKQPDGGVSAAPRFALGFFIGYCFLAAVTSNLLRRSAKDPAPAPVSGRRVAATGAILTLALGIGMVAGLHTTFHLLPQEDRLTDTAVSNLVRPAAP